jgi:putative transposase
MLKTYRYRIYPNNRQKQIIDQTIELCRYLYNCGLEHRILAYRQRRASVYAYQQINELPGIKEVFPDYKNIYSQVLQDVLRRLDKTFSSFFRRVKTGEKPGFPRYKGENRYHSFTYPQPQENMIPANGKVYLPKIGKVKIKLHREIPGNIKTVTVARRNGKYYACFTVEVESVLLPKTGRTVGIDVGVSAFVATSDGLLVQSPQTYRKAEKSLKTLQREVFRRKKGSNRRRKSVQKLASVHEKIANQRKDIAHKTARYLVNNYDLIAHEDLQIKNMVKNHHLAKSIQDSGWGMFFDILAYKAEEAGKQVVKVNPYNTSQICSGCGHIVKKTLAVRIHKCPHCGLELDRDINAARNILATALSITGSDGAIGDSLAVAG